MHRAAVLTLTILSLTMLGAPVLLSDGADADMDYEERTISMYTSPSDPSDIQCRFYEDLPNIPYVKFTDIFNTIFETTLEITDNGDGTFTMTNENDVSAVFDNVEDTISSDSYHEFIFDVVPDSISEKQSFPVDYALAETVIAPSRTVLDLSAYGFDMRGEHEVWIPTAIASDLLCGIRRCLIIYSGTSLYCFDNTGHWGGNLFPQQMTNEILDRIADSEHMRTADMIEFSYNELCFKMDTFWGNTKRTGFSLMMASMGLDAALESYSDSSRGVKALLLNEMDYNYAVGLIGLDRLVFDGGHTQLGLIPNWYMTYFYDDQMEYVEEKLSELSLSNVFDRNTAVERARQARTAAWGEGNYHVSGDTAVFSIDTFEGLSGWDVYYQEKDDYPDDTLGDFLRALDAASADANVKNFIIDLSLCSGGILGTVEAILTIIKGQEARDWTEDSLTGARYTHYFLVDTNLDGVYDEKDLCKRYDLDFGILTSRLSYSAGNLVPNLAKEMGVTIIGERSGGGCCTLTACASPEGFTEYMSSSDMHSKSDFDTIAYDRGAIPDVPLEVPETDGLPDYSSFYDLELLSAIMNEQYPKENDNGNFGITAVLVTIAAIVMIVSLVCLTRRRLI